MPSTLKDIFVTVVIAVALFEVLEHVVLPLVVFLVARKRKSSADRSAMVGQIVEVRQWEKTTGLVSLKGELWKAVSDAPLSPYMAVGSARSALMVSVVVTGVALAVFGFVKGRFTGAPSGKSAIQTTLIGGVAAAAAFIIARAVS